MADAIRAKLTESQSNWKKNKPTLEKRQSIDNARNQTLQDRLNKIKNSQESWKHKIPTSDIKSKQHNHHSQYFKQNSLGNRNNLEKITDTLAEETETEANQHKLEMRMTAEKLKSLKEIQKQAVADAEQQLKLMLEEYQPPEIVHNVTENSPNSRSSSTDKENTDPIGHKKSENNRSRSPSPEVKISHPTSTNLNLEDDLFGDNEPTVTTRSRRPGARRNQRKPNFGQKKIHHVMEDKIDYQINQQKLKKYDKSALDALKDSVDFLSEKDKLKDRSNLATRVEYPQFYYPMLLEVNCNNLHDNKVFTRLVECHEHSLDKNEASFILIVNHQEIFTYLGVDSNHLIRAKINEIVRYIMANHNFGIRNASVIEMDEKLTKKMLLRKSPKYSKFWQTLVKNGPNDSQESIQSENLNTDEILSHLHVYKFNETSRLLEVADHSCGKRPSMEYLYPNLSETGEKVQARTSDEIYIYDFWNEFYVWSGQKSNNESKTLAFKQAKILYNLRERPTWALLSKVQEEMEAALFQEKFYDWSNQDRLHKKYDLEKEKNLEKKQNSIKLASSQPLEQSQFRPARHDICKLKTTGDGLNLLDVSCGDGEVRDTDGRVLRILTEQVNITEVVYEGANNTPNEKNFTQNGKISARDRILLTAKTSLVVHWKFTIAATGQFLADNSIQTIQSFYGDQIKTDTHENTGASHEITFVWFGDQVPAPSKLPLLNRREIKEHQPRQLEIGQEPVCFWKCLSPCEIISDRSLPPSNYPIHPELKIYQSQKLEKDLNFHKFAAVNFWSIDQLGIKLQAHPLTKFDQKFTRAENYHKTFIDRSNSLVICTNDNLNKIFVIFDEKISEKDKILAFRSAINLADKNQEIIHFYYGGETLEFKTECFRTWVDRELKDENNETLLVPKIEVDVRKFLQNYSPVNSPPKPKTPENIVRRPPSPETKFEPKFQLPKAKPKSIKIHRPAPVSPIQKSTAEIPTPLETIKLPDTPHLNLEIENKLAATEKRDRSPSPEPIQNLLYSRASLKKVIRKAPPTPDQIVQPPNFYDRSKIFTGSRKNSVNSEPKTPVEISKNSSISSESEIPKVKPRKFSFEDSEQEAKKVKTDPEIEIPEENPAPQQKPETDESVSKTEITISKKLEPKIETPAIPQPSPSSSTTLNLLHPTTRPEIAPSKSSESTSVDTTETPKYPLTELQQHVRLNTVPLDLNPNRLENYLHDSDFTSVFNMKREDFKLLPKWKQFRMKKQNGLF